MDFALQCEKCGATEDLEADSLNDTHRPACARCGGKLKRTGSGSRPPRKSPVAPPAPTREVDDLRIEPFPTGVEPKDAEGFLWRGHARAASGDLSGAVADALRAVDLDPFLAPAWLLRGALRLRQGDRAERPRTSSTSCASPPSTRTPSARARSSPTCAGAGGSRGL
jgi:hypothetical protein